MLITEKINETLKRTYSSEDYKIKKLETGDLYDEAYDPIDSAWSYEETDIKIETSEDEDTEAAYAEAGRILLGQEVTDGKDNN